MIDDSAVDRAAQVVAAEDELADEVEQAIELVEVDADRLPRLGAGRHRRPARRRRAAAARALARRPGCAGASTIGSGRNVIGWRARALHEHVAEAVERGEQRVDHGAVDRAAGIADLADEILGRVREVVDRREPDHRGAALDGVQVAEHVAQQLAVVGAALDLDELAGERLDALVRLVEEQLDHVLVDGRRPHEPGGRLGGPPARPRRAAVATGARCR